MQFGSQWYLPIWYNWLLLAENLARTVEVGGIVKSGLEHSNILYHDGYQDTHCLERNSLVPRP